MNEDMQLLRSLPMSTQKALLADWVARMRLGTLRGEGLASHAGYIDMIAQENGVTIDEILALDYYPV